MKIRTRRSAVTMLTATLTVIALAGCTGGEQPATSSTSAGSDARSDAGAHPDGAGSETADAGKGGDAPTPSIGVPIKADTPFLKYFGALAAVRDTSDDPAVDARKAWWEESHAALAECMVDEGFEYVPVEYNADSGPASPTPEHSFLNIPVLAESRADVERYGYGIEPDGYDPAALWGPSESASETANLEYYNSLSEDGRRAYDRAMTGVDGADGDEPRQSPEAFEASCAGRVEAEFPEPMIDPDVALASEYDTLYYRMSAVWTDSVSQDPQTASLNEQWSGCMAQAGTALVEDFRDVPGPDPVTAYNLASNTDSDGKTLPESVDMAFEDIPLEHRAFVGSSHEIAIALADFDCRAAVDYEATLTGIVIDLEETFVEDNKDELDQLLAAAELG